MRGGAPQPLGIADTAGIGTLAQDGLTISYTNPAKARTGILTSNRGSVSAYIIHPRDEGSFVSMTDGKALGIELDSSETISDLEAKIAAQEAEASGAVNPDLVEVAEGTSAWALIKFVEGKRVKRDSWLDGKHYDPKPIRGGIRFSFEDIAADDWRTV